MKYIKHILILALVMVMANTWAQNFDPTIPTRMAEDKLSWTFNMPAGDRMLRANWKQDAGLAYDKSDTTVYLGFTFMGQELTNPHNIPVTYSIAPQTGTNSGNTINNAGVVTINGIGIDTVKAIFAGNDTLLPDTAMYIINSRAPYTLTVASNGNTMGTVTLVGTPAGVTDNNDGTYTVIDGTQVTVSATVTATPAENFHFVNWTDENSNVMGTDVQITLTITGDTTVQGNFDRDFEGSGTEDDPYLIPSKEKWNLMATRVSAGNSYEGKYFRQTADFNITSNASSVGTGTHPFCGTYDGQGHSIRISSDWPFYYVNGATIKNLHITGNNHRSQFASGLIYRLNQSDKTTNIINCRSSVEIKSGVQHDFDGTHGGFVGVTRASINFIGCVFDGKLVGVNGPYCRSNGGFIGWTDTSASVHFKDCIFAPEIVSMGDSLSCTFSRARKDTSLHFTNCYYTQAYGTEQGKQMDSITAGEYITSLTFAGVDTVYNVSGITAYANNMGLKYGDKFYAGNGDVVELSLSHADRTADGFSFNSYSASNGGIINGTTLTMPDTSTVINANYNLLYMLTLTSNDPTMGTVTLNSIPAGVTVKDANAGEYYVVPGTEVTVSATVTAIPAENFHLVNWTDENSNVMGTDAQITLTITGDTTVQGNFERDFEGSGTEDDPYLIPSRIKWNLLATRVEAGNSYEGKYFRQTADFNLSNLYRVGNGYPFSGIYDGQGHSIPLAMPFYFVDGATIKNLHITGWGGGFKFDAGLIYRLNQSDKTTNIINCRSSVEIKSGVQHDFDGTHGGFVGVTRASINFIGCVFDGKLVGVNGPYCRSNGGFIGWTDTSASVHFKDCIFAPEIVSMGDSLSCTFSRARKDTSLHFTNCYYTQAYGTEQGKQMDSITAGEYVTSLAFAGIETVYNVSGITAYANNMGLKYGDKLYAGNGDVVELSLSHADRTADGFLFNTYSASNGGIINGTTLTMPDTSTVINANYNSTTPTSPGLTPEGELTTTGNRFVDEHGQIVGSPRINQYGEIIAGGGTPTSVSSITVSKGSSGLSSDKVFYYVPGESYRDAINNNPENKLTGGYGWFYWENGVDQATIYYKEPGKQKDMSIDGNQHFGPGQTITLDSVVDPTGHTYIFVDQ